MLLEKIRFRKTYHGSHVDCLEINTVMFLQVPNVTSYYNIISVALPIL